MSLGGLAQLAELLEARTRIAELEAEVADLRVELGRVQSELTDARSVPVLHAEVIASTDVAAESSLNGPALPREAAIPTTMATLISLVLGPHALTHARLARRLLGSLRRLTRSGSHDIAE